MPRPLPEHEEKDIRNYVESQSIDHDDPDNPDNLVTLVQKVRSYRLLGTDYDVYDVHMPKTRWWVITQGTNLYDQARFPNYDEAFSFHVGIMMRLWERDGVAIEEEQEEEIGAAWRRVEAARDAIESAREAEDLQAIGIVCREAMIAFAREHQTAAWVNQPDVPPRAADFKGWATVFAQSLSSGRMRRYLSDIADKTWDVAVSLQHDANATVWDAEVLIAATAHLLDVFSTSMVKNKRKPPTRCPKCGSYRLSTDGDITARDGEPGWQQRDACGACSYRGEYTFTPWEFETELELKE
ncbi:hypothetical protein QWJ90_06300 [Microbacterium oryzae]|uniref:hypothetical protein n=1 Tax=Microbacterium oryzae TaxID=743009 RepID=UPI0025B19CE6|nr:hypothetical protein [Microbacterium oryzae]MDN3310535.1 hypothetical protein [Microbacterium oryzae]